MSKYAEPWAATLSGLKTLSGGRGHDRSRRPLSWDEGTAPVADGTAVFEVYIKTTPERLWEAITDPGSGRSTASACRRERLDRRAPTTPPACPGVVDISSGTNVEVDPPRLLVQTFDALWSDEVKAAGHRRG